LGEERLFDEINILVEVSINVLTEHLADFQWFQHNLIRFSIQNNFDLIDLLVGNNQGNIPIIAVNNLNKLLPFFLLNKVTTGES
jgi:hypothetical protein